MPETMGATATAAGGEQQSGLIEKVPERAVVEAGRDLPFTGAEYWIGRADGFDFVEVLGDLYRGDQRAELALAAHIHSDERAALAVATSLHVAPAQIAGFGRPHAGVGHHQDEPVDHLPIPADI